MSVADIRKGAEQKMQRSIDAFKNDLSKIRTGRAHTGLLDHIQCDYYGSPVPISQVANLTLIPVEGGPHNIGWTHPDECNKALLDFLAEDQPNGRSHSGVGAAAAA